MSHQPLKFLYLKYKASEISELINKYDDIQNFVFAYYAPKGGTELQLISYVQIGTDCNNLSYAAETNILTPFKDEFFSVEAPVIMSNNIISIEEMKSLISLNEINSVEYLLFTPVISSSGHLCYSIEAKLKDIGIGGPPVIVTNPSPPAT